MVDPRLLAILSFVLLNAAALLLQDDLGTSGSVQTFPTIAYSSLEELTATLVSEAAMAESAAAAAADATAAICNTLAAQLRGAVTAQNSTAYEALRDQPWYFIV